MYQLVLLVGALSVVTSACSRDPVEFECPTVSAGQLVITELRGDQSGEDTYGQWIEIYNATDATVDLFGAQVTMQKLDGSGDARILVRAEAMTIQARAYTVIGRFAADALPDHVNYGYQLDFDSNLYDTAAVELNACGELIDQVIYHDLTGTGTWALDGAADPDATTNDDEAEWCVDANDTMPDPTMLGIPGTPGERNPTCVP